MQLFFTLKKKRKIRTMGGNKQVQVLGKLVIWDIQNVGNMSNSAGKQIRCRDLESRSRQFKGI